MFAKKAFPRGGQRKSLSCSTSGKQHMHMHDPARPPDPPLSSLTTSSANHHASSPLVSPLQMTFDFELSPSDLPFRVSEESLARPKTSDGPLTPKPERASDSRSASATRVGLHVRKSTLAFPPPVLPPIPRVASTEGREGRGHVASNDRERRSRQQTSGGEEGANLQPRGRHESDDIAAARRPSHNHASAPTAAHPIHPLPTTGGATSMQERPRPWTAGATSEESDVPRMQSSIFPPAPRPHSPPLPELDTGPVMTREFIDSRDKPYSNPTPTPTASKSTARTPMLSIHTQSANAYWKERHASSPGSAPPAVQTPTSVTSLRAAKISGARLSQNASADDLRAALRRAPFAIQGSSASAQRTSSRSSNVKAQLSRAPSTLTVGTPYGETSAAFPLPQHVATRPKTVDATSTMAGVSVPTHHTSARPAMARAESGNSTPKADKSERRRTRLFNPMSLLARRKSGQDAIVVDKSVAAQAYERQKSVAAVGISELPTDYVGIKGKVVHDFSAPKPARGLSYETGNDFLTSPPMDHRQLQGSSSASPVPLTQPDFSPEHLHFHAQHPSDGSGRAARSSAHSPVFREMLAEHPETANRVSSLNAERLENKDFLTRVSQNSGHMSKFSQESAVLPPFARRSQQLTLDPLQASLYNDVDSQRSSTQSTSGRRERDSGSSSIEAGGAGGAISPVTPRTSHAGTAAGGEASSSLGVQSISPISPTFSSGAEMAGNGRSISTTPAAAPAARISGSGFETRQRDAGETGARLSGGDSSQPSMTPVAEDAPWSSRGRVPYPDRANASETVGNSLSGMSSSLALPPSSSSQSVSLSMLVPDRTSSLGTTPDQLTPEISQAEFVRPLNTTAAGGVKVVEKRASAVGHTKRSNRKPKHQASVASRFSFQFGGESAAEEEKLEEKHRKIKGNRQDVSRSRSPDQDDEDEFDEDAIDDMDEFEVQQQHKDPQVSMSANAPWIHSNVAIGMLGVQQGMRLAQSDDGSAYDSQEEDDGDAVVHTGWKPEGSEQTYADHPDFMAHYRGGSKATTMTYGSTLDHYMQGSGNPVHSQPSYERDKSTASALTVNTDILGPPKPPVAVVAGQDPGAQPQTTGYPMPAVLGPPPLPPREVKSATTDDRKSRRISGVSLSSPRSQEYRASRISSLKALDAEHEGSEKLQAVSPSTNNPMSRPMTVASEANSGLGLSGFQGFKFSEDSTDSLVGSRTGSPKIDSPRPATRHGDTTGGSGGWHELAKQGSTADEQQPVSSIGTESSALALQDPAKPSELSKAYGGSVGKHISAGNKRADRSPQHARSESEAEDDMYFDDGGFEQEIRNPVHYRSGQMPNEDKLDEDGYLPRINQHAIGPRSGILGPADIGGYHQRDTSAFSIASLGSDGPYPSFAMGGNLEKQRQRESQMLLEDLVLQGPVDPRLIPQRNPSEDAKRLGLSGRVPPLPVQESGDVELVRRMQTSLAAYHAALAEAANRAQEEGRFARVPSTTSSAVTASLKTKGSFDDRSFYSRDDGAGHLAVNGGDGVSRSASNLTRGSEPEGSKTSEYSPAKFSFDFGFDASQSPHKDSMTFLDDSSFIDEFGNDDDIVAAANAEALANDEDGFYGSEFGFYARARPNSSDAEAINGGFFGDNGDDGLARNRSGREPNLTPITERSEFSTRNSFVNLGHGAVFGPVSAGLYGSNIGPASPALARMPVTPIVPENDVANFDQLRKLRVNAFGGSNGSLQSAASHGRNNGSMSSNAGLNAVGSSNSARSPTGGQGYFGPMGGAPMSYGYSDHATSPSASNSNPSSAHPSLAGGANASQSDTPPSRAWASHQDDSSPRSSSGGLGGNGQQQFSSPLANSFDLDATPRKLAPTESPGTIRKAAPPLHYGEEGRTHSRKGSDSVTYVKEKDPAGSGRPQWVLERRRTGELGQMELVGREVVQGGWI